MNPTMFEKMCFLLNANNKRIRMVTSDTNGDSEKIQIKLQSEC